ncbi:histidine phosphatase family protein [Cryobacterium psychrophilum]|uniref:Histidine phosphatase family protein n=1 Tax=Cryobacterium psychrophilum TaxID=41988 RepID=A0A4Y8KRU7_9MICO|nr:histidine phosphatase family protein [Cryobacterium psychrophilum]TDW28691.1 putative phosphoglycerate mutase [Cryobacterium psychrophilum]TFD82350.1 histidine phosphatase family protein [Cryobacterium psychrophilum]
MRLLLIRHGQTPSNVLGLLDTAHPGPGLTAVGTAQAAAVPGSLRVHSTEAIFASTLIRTQLTAAPLAAARDLPVQVLPGLHEIEAGALEGLSDRDSVRKYMETVFAWVHGDLSAAMPGAANGQVFLDRFDADIAHIAATTQTAVVFSHGASIRLWTAMRAINVPPMFTAHNDLDNTGIAELTGSPEDGWTLQSYAGQPFGGSGLADPAASDPMGHAVDSV